MEQRLKSKCDSNFIFSKKLKNLFKDENIEEDEKIMVVGIIDLFFENENGEIILLDYKTDYVTKENLEEVKARYKVQLDLYKSAIEDISGKKSLKMDYIYLE